MNIKSTFLASALLAAATASAATFSPGDKWSSLPSYDYGSSMVIPFEYGVQYGATQTVFSTDEIGKLSPVTGSDGKTTVNKITSVSFPIYFEGGYAGALGTAEFKAYLTPYDGVEFAKEGNDYMWAAYDAEGTVSGSFTIDGATDDDLLEVLMMGDYYVTINFDRPYECDGKGILLTLLFDNQLEDEYGMDWTVGTYSINPNKDVKRIRSGNKTGDHNLSGKIPYTFGTIPVVNFTYEQEVKEPEAGGEVMGDPTTLNIGNWDSPTVGSESTGAKMPCDPGNYTYAFAQAVYTPEQLVGLYSVGADGVTTADINSLTYKLSVEGMPYGSISAEVYIENTDLTALPLVDNKHQWVAYNKEHKGTVAEMSFYDYDYLSGGLEFKAEFSTPLRYEGKSLLVTWVTDGYLNEYEQADIQSQVMLGQKGQSAVKSGNSSLDNLTGDASNVGNDLPVLQLGITPVTSKPATRPVTFANVKPSLRKVSVNPSIVGWGGVKEANALCVEFDLVDEATDGSYDIKLGNNVVGEITGTHGEIAYIAKPAADLYLTVVPKAEGAIGSSYSVALEEVEALFPLPQVTVGEEQELFTSYEAFSKYDYNRATLQGIATFNFACDYPVVKMRGIGQGQAAVVTASNCPDGFEKYIPVNDYSDYHANNGRMSFYCEKLDEVLVEHGLIDKSKLNSLSIKAKFSIDVPMITREVPSLSASFEPAEEGSYDVASSTGFKSVDVSIDFNNGSSYGYDKNTLTATFDGSKLVENVTYPGSLTYKVEKEFVDIYAPAAHNIHYCFVEDASAPEGVALLSDELDIPQDLEWTAAGSNIYSHPVAVPGKLHIKSVDADGNDKEYTLLTINADGSVLSIDGISADGIADGEARYYDLQGRRVTDPAPGLYIRLQGSRATKVRL